MDTSAIVMDREAMKDFKYIMDTFTRIVGDELQQAISELQILQDKMQSGDFELQSPTDHTRHQRDFLRPYVVAFAEALRELPPAEEDDD